ncbi:hypothetical protein ACVW00_000853 [Marmoricola sp. URHA0025 HA25]
MDQSSPPTAAELGISDVEYERIMREMRRRGLTDEPEPEPFGAARPSRSKRWSLAVVGVIAVVTLVGTFGATDPEPAYSFMRTVQGHPVTYSSCRPVQVAVYPAGGPPNAEALVREAVALLRGATGLDIVVTGVFGGYAPNWNFEAGPVHPDDPISVSWQDGNAIAQITDHVAGVGGSRVVVTGRNGSEHLVAGTIALSRGYFAYLARSGDHGKEMAVILHEFGHVFGLGHVGSRHELMYKDVTDLTTFGPGDLEGLRLVGHGPCT